MSERRRKRSRPSESVKEFREELKPKTQGHKEYIRCIIENTITFCTGPAGSSKSYSSIGIASQYLLDNRVDKIIIVRPAIEASPKGLGFLPGGVNDKLSPYVQPAIEHLQRFLGRNTFGQYRTTGRIVIEALEYMRGRTFDNSFIIVEEVQNCTTEQIKMIVTRIGNESKMVLNGDTDQSDIYHPSSDYKTDLEYVIMKLKKAKVPEVGIVELSTLDVVRHRLITPLLQALK